MSANIQSFNLRPRKRKYSYDVAYWQGMIDKHKTVSRISSAAHVPLPSVVYILDHLNLKAFFEKDINPKKPTTIQQAHDQIAPSRYAEMHNIDWGQAPIAKLYRIPWTEKGQLGPRWPLGSSLTTSPGSGTLRGSGLGVHDKL